MDKVNNTIIKEDEILTELQSKVDTEAQQIVDKLKELAKLEDKLEKQLAMYNIQKQSTQQRIDITQEKIKEAILKNTKLEERVSSLKEKLNELESKQGQLENKISMLNEKVSEVEEEENKQKLEIELQNGKSKLIDNQETLKDSKEGGIRKLYNEEVKKYRDLNDLKISDDNNINTDNDIRTVGLLEIVNKGNETKVKDIYSSSELGLGLDLDFDLDTDLDFDYGTATDLGQDNTVKTTEEELKNSSEFKPKAKEDKEEVVEKEKVVVVGDTSKQSVYEVLDTNNKIKDKDIDTDIQAEISSIKQPPLELVKEYLTNLGIDIIPTIELKNLLTQEQIEHLVEDGELYYVGTGYMLATDLGI